MYLLRWSLLVLLHATQLYAQDSCSNYGLQNGSACACPVGWGGSDCSSPSCGGTVFEGSRRKYETSSQGNLTAAGCGCETDWTGLGCNVCQTSNACQTAYSNSPYGSSSGSTSYTGINNTMVCSKEARVWSAGQMSCSVQVRVSFPRIEPFAHEANATESYISCSISWRYQSKHHEDIERLPQSYTQHHFLWRPRLSISTAAI